VSDGLDAALVAVALLDNNGRLCRQAGNNVTLKVVSGPGRILGMDAGDPASVENQTTPYHSAFHGLVRGIVRVTQVVATNQEQLAVLRALHPESELSATASQSELDARSSTATRVCSLAEAATEIVLEATAEGIAGS